MAGGKLNVDKNELFEVLKSFIVKIMDSIGKSTDHL